MDAKGKKAEILLARKAIKGDEQAFVALYENNIRVILYQVGKLLYVKEDVMDVAQEVVIHMYSSIGKLKSPEAFRTWMYRIVETTCISHNRKAGKYRNDEDIGDYENFIEDEDMASRPAEAAESNEAARSVQAMIDGLPEKQRLALFMYYYEDMSYRQIAKALGITISTVSTNIMKARTTLKRNMERNINPLEAKKLDSMGLLIASAFKADIAQSVTSAQVDAVIHACGEQLANFAASHVAAGHVAVKAGVSGAKVGVMAPVAVSVAVGATAVVGYVVTGGPYIPDASIQFAASESPSQANPKGAVLVTDEGTPIRWSIVNGDGEALASGEGIEIGAEAFDLPAGTYTVEWVVTDGRGRSATVRREMSINN